MEVTIKPVYSTKIKTSCDKNHGAFLCVSDFYCYFCTKTRDIDSNSQQSAEINTVANSLPLFYPFSQTSYKQGGYKSFPELFKNLCFTGCRPILLVLRTIIFPERAFRPAMGTGWNLLLPNRDTAGPASCILSGVINIYR